jgi:hypothetical protein
VLVEVATPATLAPGNYRAVLALSGTAVEHVSHPRKLATRRKWHGLLGFITFIYQLYLGVYVGTNSKLNQSNGLNALHEFMYTDAELAQKLG